MTKKKTCEDVEVYTLGFSNRSWEDTVAILQAYQIELVVDVRTLPGSRKFPRFNKESLEIELPVVGIEYRHVRDLGGFKKTQDVEANNSGWRNVNFRNYADYMQTPSFLAALDELIALLKEKRTVYCCTEAVFWRCHRALISDALLVRGFRIGHIFTATHCEMHRMTSFAKVDGLQVTYPDSDN